MAVSQVPSTWLKTFIASAISPRLVLEEHEDRFVVPYLDKLIHIITETGYLHIQATRPDTVGVGLNSSPLGLAAYIVEKFAAFSSGKQVQKPNGGLQDMFTLDELIDNIMIYWWTGSITSSMRFYKENIGRMVNSEYLNSLQRYMTRVFGHENGTHNDFVPAFLSKFQLALPMLKMSFSFIPKAC